MLQADHRVVLLHHDILESPYQRVQRRLLDGRVVWVYLQSDLKPVEAVDSAAGQNHSSESPVSAN